MGNQLRKFRLKCGFTQKDIAETLNVSRSTYSYYELGVTSPDVNTLAKLSHYYNVPVEAFYDETYALDVSLSDSEGRRRRTSRSPSAELDQVGDLCPDERTLILLLRSNEVLNAKQLLDYLQERLADGKSIGKKE